MTGPHYRLRTQAEIEARLLELIDGMATVDDTRAECISWHCGQLAALLFALGAEHKQAVATMYELWQGRHEQHADGDEN